MKYVYFDATMQLIFKLDRSWLDILWFCVFDLRSSYYHIPHRLTKPIQDDIKFSVFAVFNYFKFMFEVFEWPIFV